MLCFRKPVYRNLWATNVFRNWKDYKYTYTFLASLCPSIGIRNGEAFQEFRICKTNSMVRLGYFSPSWAFGVKLKGGYKEEAKYEVLESSFKPHLHGRKFLHGSDEKKYAYQKNWFGTDRFSRAHDFAPSVPYQNFTRARTMSRSSPSTDKIGTRSWKSSPARIKCAV